MRAIDKIYVDGAFVTPHGQERFDLYNPSTGKVIGHVRLADEVDARAYRGMPQALTDVIGGQIDCVFADPASAQGLVQDGKLRALAVTSSKRLESMPDLPTIGESGLPGYELAAWVGVYVRAKTAPEIVAKLNDLVTAFVNSAAARDYLATIGATPFPSTPQELAAFQEADTRRWAEIVETAKIERK
jgi:tripartite-type tricarboxylate transporter receptor subunit TctC